MKILFLCVQNSARSQIAEGLARWMAPAGVQVWSAGSEPLHVRPQAIEVMDEWGIDIRAQTSKGLDAVPVDAMDAVITLCAEEKCPILPGHVRRLHWGLPDPAAPGDGAPEARLEGYRAVRDALRTRIAQFYEDEVTGR